MSVLSAYIRSIPAAARIVFGNPELRRLELAFAGFGTAEWAVLDRHDRLRLRTRRHDDGGHCRRGPTRSRCALCAPGRAPRGPVCVPVVEVGLLRALPLFSALDPITLERLARSLVRVEAWTGSAVIRAGDVGDRFYVIADGRIDVVRDGAHVASLGRGQGFGEIALLHRVTRTADCTAAAPTVLFALEKDDFLRAVAANVYTSAAAEELVTARGAPNVAPEPRAP